MIPFIAKKLRLIMILDGVEEAQEKYIKVFEKTYNKKYKKGVDRILRKEEETERIIVEIPEKNRNEEK